ncbi:hypothetical protein HYT55_02495 [Candidatus Woesearchaeota archaeon]|nr:hypothetical protein [Candidatus Woesearchaeota archaeon]
MNTLLIGEIHPDAKILLEQNTKLTKITNDQFSQIISFPEIEAVVLRTFTPLKAAELQKLPRLKCVVICSVGTDNLDLELLKQKNIRLIHCPGTNANSVAEHTLYLMLSLLREDSKKPFAELKGKTVGILGFGAIGKIVAKKLQGFEAKVLAFDVIPQDPEVVKQLHVTMVDQDSLLKEVEIITVHVPLNKYTEKIVNKRCFSQMRDNSFFVNTSRAEVIDEEALIDEWKKGKFRGVGVDVCSENFALKIGEGNVIITDHCAAQGEDSFREQCVKPVEEFMKILERD